MITGLYLGMQRMVYIRVINGDRLKQNDGQVKYKSAENYKSKIRRGVAKTVYMLFHWQSQQIPLLSNECQQLKFTTKSSFSFSNLNFFYYVATFLQRLHFEFINLPIIQYSTSCVFYHELMFKDGFYSKLCIFEQSILCG